MSSNKSVVTPERFKLGLLYNDWMGQIKVNKDRFEEAYKSFHVDDADASYIRGLLEKGEGPAKVLILGEDWCPDVIRGLPVMVKFAEAVGMEARIFPRDENIDVMNEFLKDGEFQSIPTFVFYNRDHKYLDRWVERPQIATKEMAEIQKVVDVDLAGKSDDEQRLERRNRGEARWSQWQLETAKEIRALFS